LRDVVSGKHLDYTVDDQHKELRINYKSYNVDKVAIIQVSKLTPRPEYKHRVKELSLIDQDEANEVMKTMRYNFDPCDQYNQYITLIYGGHKFTCEVWRHDDGSFDILEKILQDIKSGKYTQYTLSNVQKIDRGGCIEVWYEDMVLTLPYFDHTESKSFNLDFKRKT